MEVLLVGARALHFTAAISLAGIFGFECLVAGPALRRAGAEPAGESRPRWRILTWVSLVVALVSGAGWLTATAASMSGQSPIEVLTQGTLGTVLTRTRFGEDWLLRLGLAALIAVCLLTHRVRAVGWLAFGLAMSLLGSLAWAGHGAATPGAPGELHLAGDVLHLLAAGMWLGTLVPLELMLSEASRSGSPSWRSAACVAARRFSYLAGASVAVLLAGGIINTWFLAGTAPALVGTDYGRLLLTKIGLFVAMLLVASVNLLRLTPRLAAKGATMADATIGQLRRNALIETALGLGVVGIVGLIGTWPPGLHTEPGWPFPFRIETAALPGWAMIAAVTAAAIGFGCTVAVVVAAAAGRYRLVPALTGAIVLCAAAVWLPLRPAIEPAYPTSFYAPAEPYDAASVVKGAALYAENCAACHGASGRGDGPAAAGLPTRPADLTGAHLFAHSPGDLFWWIGHGRGNGAMPGFGTILSPQQRWDLVNFLRAHAAAVLSQQIGPQVTAVAAYPVPNFAFEAAGVQSTLRRALDQGPVLLVLFAGPAPTTRLQQLATARSELAGAGLQVMALGIEDETKPGAEDARPLSVAVDSAARKALAPFRSPSDGGETELLLDRNGGIRARWTAADGNVPDVATLTAQAAHAADFAVAAPSHAGHMH